nr:uncharacterized protein LOC111426770 [Onthophagus taurus]
MFVKPSKMSKVDEDNKYVVLLLGFVAASLSPFLLVWYALHCTTYVVSKILIPVFGLAIVFLVGFPLLCTMKWIYATYAFIYNMVINFILAIVQWMEENKTNSPISTETRRIYASSNDFDFK